MQQLESAHAQHMNFRHARTGHVFGGRFNSRRVKGDRHLVSTLVYVSLNPVRAGMVSRPEEWRWCSYAATVGLAPPPRFLSTDLVLELFDPARTDVARARFSRAVHDSLEREP